MEQQLNDNESHGNSSHFDDASDESKWGTTSSAGSELQCYDSSESALDGNVVSQGVKRYRKLREHSCETCQDNFSNRSTLAEHKATHVQFVDHECEVCGANFVHQFRLLNHLKTHTRVKEFRCEHCKKYFIKRSVLSVHLQSHAEVKQSGEGRWRSFTRSGHRDKLPVSPKIQGSKVYKKCSHAKVHLGTKGKRREIGVDYKNVCGICGQCFLHLNSLFYHLKTHARTRSQCDFCGKVFLCPADLLQHTNIHNGVRNYLCAVCGKCFVFKNALVNHTNKMHADENPQ